MNTSCLTLGSIVPELFLAGMAFLLIPLAALAHKRWKQVPRFITLSGFLIAMVLTLRMINFGPTEAFCNTYAVDGYGTIVKLLLLIGGFIISLLFASYFSDPGQEAHAQTGLAFAVLGSFGLVSSTDLGLIILFFQMISLASYPMVGLIRSDRRGNEAALKLFLFSAVSFAVMAFGMTFLYGLSGNLELGTIGNALVGADTTWVILAFGLVVAGYAFEMTIVPFQFWAPDVYEGTTAPVAGFLSVIPKIAGFAALLRIATLLLPEADWWPTLIGFAAAITMTYGNLLALRQKRLKRLFAYSSIAQAGYVLMGIAAVNQSQLAIPAILFFLVSYLFMNLGAFAVISHIEKAWGNDNRESLLGLGKSSPVIAALFAIFILSLAGIPPLAGFAGKVLLLTPILKAGLWWLAIIGIINMVISLYYYILLIADMYLHKGSEKPLPMPSWYAMFALGITGIATVIFGIFPETLLTVKTFLTTI